MELNDNIQVVLTEFGATFLNTENKKMTKLAPSRNWKTDYKEGDIYTTQLWGLFVIFRDACSLGVKLPFTNLEKRSEIKY